MNPIRSMSLIAVVAVAVFYVAAGEPRVSDEQKGPEVCNFETLSAKQAEILEGRTVRFRTRLSMMQPVDIDHFLYRCPYDTFRIIFFAKENAPTKYDPMNPRDIVGPFLIEGRLEVIKDSVRHRTVLRIHDTKIVKH
jgi:hypothetical protein